MTVKGRRFAVLAAVLVAANVFFWLAASGFALPGGGLIQQLLGGRMIRADIVWQSPNGGVRETLLYRGVITAVTPTSITLREKDRPADVIQITPTATVRFGATATTVSALHKGMRVVVAGSPLEPADTIQVEGYGGG